MAIFKNKIEYGDGPKVFCKHCKIHEWTEIIERNGNLKLRCKACRRWK